MAPTISKLDAYKLAKKAGIKFHKEDSDVQDTTAMIKLSAIAKLAGYRKPTNANGSTARYFFYHLVKKQKEHNWK